MIRVEALSGLRARREDAGHPYLEFLRVRSMSAGLYELPAGTPDPQGPHAQDELYVVVAGRATFTGAGERRQVSPGDAIFVPAGVEHRFTDITDDLSVIVVFAPPEA